MLLLELVASISQNGKYSSHEYVNLIFKNQYDFCRGTTKFLSRLCSCFEKDYGKLESSDKLKSDLHNGVLPAQGDLEK